MPGHLEARLSLFNTAIGWIGTCGRGNIIRSVTMGHSSRDAAAKRLNVAASGPCSIGDWNSMLKQRLEDFADGMPVNFLDFEIELGHLSPFMRLVVEKCRQIPYGETRSYGELAAMAGSSRAARAVGNVMRGNRCPLVVPCHRVVHGDGRIGNFSAPQGIKLKKRLLAMEAASRGISRQLVPG